MGFKWKIYEFFIPSDDKCNDAILIEDSVHLYSSVLE